MNTPFATKNLSKFSDTYIHEANRAFTKLTETWPEIAISNRNSIIAHMHTEKMGQYVELVEAVRDLADLPDSRISEAETDESQFKIIAPRKYTGADGVNRQVLTKYCPVHVYPSLSSLIEESESKINLSTSKNDPKRPGLILMSGYRSPWYQIVIIIRAIAEHGIDSALERVSLSHSSQHSNFQQPAFDFIIIGDKVGAKYHDPKTGKVDDALSFERSVEFEYLMEAGPRRGFWLPYHPNPKDPLSHKSTSGIIFEPWHWQYVGDRAPALMEQYNVYESIRIRKNI